MNVIKVFGVFAHVQGKLFLTSEFLLFIGIVFSFNHGGDFLGVAAAKI